MICKIKKIFGLLLLCATMALTFTSCFKDEGDNDDGISLTKSQVVGTWVVVWAEQDGQGMDIPQGLIYMTLKNDGSYTTVMYQDYYIGTYKISGNTVVGTTLDPITEYYKFESFDGRNAVIDYTNSVGEKYKFKAIKR